MMKSFKNIAAIALLAVAPLAGAGQTWKMPTAYPDGNFHTENVRWFADEVHKATNGDLTIEVYSGASMFKMGEIKRALRTAQVPIAEFFLSAYGNEDPIYDADSVPFLAVGQEQAARLYKVQKPFLDKRFNKEGLVSLYSVVWPGQGFYTKNPLTSTTDFKGMKLRGQTPIVARMGELLGAVPVNVQFVEVPQAFQTGVISAMLTAGSTGVDTQAWEYTKYFYNASAFHPRNVVAVNAKAWDALPEATRKAVEGVARRAEERGWQRAAELQSQSRKTLAEKGMTVVDPSPQLMSQFTAVGDKMITEWAKKAGPDGAEIAKQMGKATQ
jgi:TRAP-type C4-dicarboxylate transport system substrate-binding protein